jgi:ATP-dependent Zn protease
LAATLQLLTAHRDGLNRLTRALLEHETLEADALKEVLDSGPEVAAPATPAAQVVPLVAE